MIDSKGDVSCYLGNTNNRSCMSVEEIRRSFETFDKTFIGYEKKSFPLINRILKELT